MTSPYADIRRRLAEATGPDRELDAAIVAALNNAVVKRYPPTDDFGPRDRWQFWSLDGKHFLGSEAKFPVAPLTASLDAALALVEEKLPGWGVQVGHPLRRSAGGVWAKDADDGGWFASVFRERRKDKSGFWPGHFTHEGELLEAPRGPGTYRANGALAVLSALFAALEAQHG